MRPGEIECPEGDAADRFGDFGLLIRLVDKESDKLLTRPGESDAPLFCDEFESNLPQILTELGLCVDFPPSLSALFSPLSMNE